MWGSFVGGESTSIMELEDKDGNVFTTYCMDKDIGVEYGWSYSIVNVEDNSNIDKETADLLRNIVKHAYPFLSIEKIREITGLTELTKRDAIAGAQIAIWHYTNGIVFEPTGDIKTLYEFYLNLGESETSATDISNIDINHETYFEEDIRNLLITFDSNDIYDIKYTFDKDLNNEYEIIEDQNSILIKNVPLDLEFKIIVTGKQDIVDEVYFFFPKDGEESSQSLIGANSGTINVSNSKSIKVEDEFYEIEIEKKDGNNNKVLEGVLFELSNTKDFSGNILKGATDKTGKLIFDNISNGKWYLKEVKTLKNYKPLEEVMEIVVDNESVKKEILNYQYTGNLIIKKLDSEDKKILKGSTIGIYKDNELFKEIKTTNKEIVINNIPIGTYHIKEIEAPNGYIINLDEFVVEIKENKTSTVEIVNHKIYNTGLNGETIVIVGLISSILITFIRVKFCSKEN